jgi:hypothetical protein
MNLIALQKIVNNFFDVVISFLTIVVALRSFFPSRGKPAIDRISLVVAQLFIG